MAFIGRFFSSWGLIPFSLIGSTKRISAVLWRKRSDCAETNGTWSIKSIFLLSSWAYRLISSSTTWGSIALIASYPRDRAAIVNCTRALCSESGSVNVGLVALQVLYIGPSLNCLDTLTLRLPTISRADKLQKLWSLMTAVFAGIVSVTYAQSPPVSYYPWLPSRWRASLLPSRYRAGVLPSWHFGGELMNFGEGEACEQQSQSFNDQAFVYMLIRTEGYSLSWKHLYDQVANIPGVFAFTFQVDKHCLHRCSICRCRTCVVEFGFGVGLSWAAICLDRFDEHAEYKLYRVVR